MKVFLTGLLGFLLATPLYATIVDNGYYTSDTATNLDWLDVTQTRGLSYLTVEQMIMPGGALEGWRFATAQEFETLVFNFGYLPPGDCPSDLMYCNIEVAGEDPVIDRMIQTLGDTYDASLDSRYPNEPDVILSDASATGGGYTRGYLLRGSPFYVSDFEVFAAIIWDMELVERGTEQIILDMNDSVNTTEYVYWDGTQGDTIGSYLVRTSTVPLPPTALLFLSSTIGLIVLKRIKGNWANAITWFQQRPTYSYLQS